MEENPQRPLVLHTLPRAKDHPVPQQNASAQPHSALQPERDTAVGEDSPAEEPVKKKPKITRTTSTIPRLVSVVEIIKREYAKEAAKRRATENANDSSSAGLHQYNELSTLEDLGIVEQQEDAPDDAEQLRQALEGKNLCASGFIYIPEDTLILALSLKQKLTPHLKVTLSVRTQPMLETRGAT